MLAGQRGQSARLGASGDHERLELETLASGQLQPLRGRVKALGTNTESEFHVEIGQRSGIGEL